VLKTFRAHLALHDAIRFADVLPPVLRAIFVSGWDPEQPPRPFGTREELTREAQSLRRDHNFSPDTCIGDVARALSRHVDRSAFAAALERLPADARAFWDPGA